MRLSMVSLTTADGSVVRPAEVVGFVRDVALDREVSEWPVTTLVSTALGPKLPPYTGDPA